MKRESSALLRAESSVVRPPVTGAALRGLRPGPGRVVLRMADAMPRDGVESLRTIVRTLEERAPIGIGVVDRNLCIRRINQRLAAIGGRSIAAHLGRHVSEILPGLAHIVVPQLERVLATGEPLLGEEVVGRIDERDEADRCWRVEFHPLSRAGGSPWGVMAIVSEITAEIRAEHAESWARAARAADLSKDEFVAMLSHEIRTPLHIFGLGVECLATTALDDDQRELVATLQRSADALSGLVRDAVDLEGIARGELTVVEAELDLPCFAAEIEALFAPQARAHGLTLAVALLPLPARMAGLRVDGERLRQVLVNLIGNALKFTEEGSIRVSFDLEEAPARAGEPVPDPLLCVEVADSGCGLAPEQLAHLLAGTGPARGHHPRSGSGLGLHISRRIAEALGGRLEGRSEPGRGTRFRVVVPMRRGERAGPLA